MTRNNISFVVGSFAVALSMSIGIASAATSSPFVDVPADYDFREAIGFLKDKKIVQGYPDQTYKPDASVSRAEFVKIALKLGGRAQMTGATELFKDVHKDDWFFVDIMTATKLGIVQGVSGTGTGTGNASAFLPNGKITRAQALKIALKALQYEPKVSYVGDIAPSDVSSKAWFYPLVMSARRLNILTDSDDGLFYPDLVITRGEAAEILYRVQMVKDQRGAAVDITRGWIDVEKSIPGGAGFDNVTFKVPKTWVAFKDGSRVTVIKKDPRMSVDYELVTPLSAKIVVKTATLDATLNETADSYFEKIKAMNREAYKNNELKFSSVVLMGQPALDVMVPSLGIENWYIWMPNRPTQGTLLLERQGTGLVTRGVVSLYGQYGIGSMSLKLHESIRGIVRTLAVKEVGAGVGPKIVDEKLVSAVQAKVLVEKVGKATIDSLGDALIVETDEIGVGTGPVDYYFSDKVQLSLKYERASDTILAVRTGKTTAF